MRKLSNVLLAVAIALAAYGIYSHYFVGEEARVRKAVSRLERAVEKRSLLRLAPLISKDYTDSTGNDYTRVIAAAKYMFNEYAGIAIHMSGMTIEVREDGATAKGHVVVHGRRSGGTVSESIIPEKDSSDFELVFEKDEDSYLLASYTPLP